MTTLDRFLKIMGIVFIIVVLVMIVGGVVYFINKTTTQSVPQEAIDVKIRSYQQPRDWPSDVPIYTQGFTGNSLTSVPTPAAISPNSQAGSVLMIETRDSVKKVDDFYRIELLSQGWEYQTVIQESKVTLISATKDDRLVIITISASDQKTLVTLGLGKK